MKIKKNKCLLLLLVSCLMIACDQSEDDFSSKDSYLYVWNIRSWEVGQESKLSDFKITYFFKGDTARVKQVNFWIIKEKSTLYMERAMEQQDRAIQIKTLQKDPNQKEYKNQCSFRFADEITTDFDGDPILPGNKYRLVVKAIGTDDRVVDSPATESGIFEIYDPNKEEEDNN